jgi:hypothetical protein
LWRPVVQVRNIQQGLLFISCLNACVSQTLQASSQVDAHLGGKRFKVASSARPYGGSPYSRPAAFLIDSLKLSTERKGSTST